ncbi:Non-specific lipid-transfer protein like [Actinidia chinensis var. chinensis]|uniref:Non-specific lipid-transfer protein n=1 Tax=Actinidia chinensis var. chinensis TaxID=1590841 RepID=A0A2R6QKX6_ACTCC|nr:Non-specific lipid-transfer protein like [Actinidia chinensis var. chinensis]
MKSSNQALPFMPILLLLALLLSPASAITCSDVIRDMSPCVSYLKSGSGMPPAPCRTGAQAIASAATTTDKQTACNCIKSASKQMNVNPSLVKALPGNCRISLGFTLDPNIDCST